DSGQQFPERIREGDRVADFLFITADAKNQRVPRAIVPKRANQLGTTVNRATIDLEHEVTLLKSGRGSAAIWQDATDSRSLVPFELNSEITMHVRPRNASAFHAHDPDCDGIRLLSDGNEPGAH